MVVLGSAAMANAQTDTTGLATDTTKQIRRYMSKDWSKVDSKEIPGSLRTTLQAGEYKGWESGTLYKNKNTNEFTLEMLPGTAGATPETYQFDRGGKRITVPK